jgi:flagellar basal body P-ring formation protein FlgA
MFTGTPKNRHPLLISVLSILLAAAMETDALLSELVRETLIFTEPESRKVLPVDIRLAKSLCVAPWRFAWTRTKSAVVVTCSSRPKWQLYLPVENVGTPLPDTGSVLRRAGVAQPNLVMRGQPVNLIASGDGYAISITATALDDGVAGSTIRVRTTRNATITRAVVMPDGAARIIP